MNSDAVHLESLSAHIEEDKKEETCAQLVSSVSWTAPLFLQGHASWPMSMGRSLSFPFSQSMNSHC